MNDREKQIEEMAKVLCGITKECENFKLVGKCLAYYSADILYNAGYRKVPEDSVVLSEEDYYRWITWTEDKKIYTQSELDVRVGIYKVKFERARKETAEQIFKAVFVACNTELIACEVDLADNGGKYWKGKLSGIRNTIADIMNVAKQFGVEMED